MKSTVAGTLLGGGSAFVAGLPKGFDFLAALRHAQRISLATAFAHKSGWSMIVESVEHSKAALQLLTGLDFCRTEPSVLADWLRLQNERRDTRAFLATRPGTTFHPKVLIVENRAQTFAIVGSGNLSAGGFRDNVECALYTDDAMTLAVLIDWFNTLCADRSSTTELDQASIDRYLPRFKKAQSLVFAARKQQKQAETEILAAQDANMAQWSKAVRLARNYLASAQFSEDWAEWKTGVRKIRSALKAPSFKFSKSDWDDFYSVWAFGHIIPINRDSAFGNAKRIQAGFRHLLDSTRAPKQRLDDVLEEDGRFRVSGVGLNVVSKVLAIHEPMKWPVYNAPVAEALKSFGYEAPRGESRGGKYLAFARLMDRFRQDVGAADMLVLDPFFYRRGAELKIKKRA